MKHFADSFSVLLPVYIRDCPNLFERALASISQQTLLPKYIVVVCDGPVSPKVDRILIEAVRISKPEVRVIRIKDNMGLANALNHALEYIDTEWVARADADDVNLPCRFEVTNEFIVRNPDVVLFGSAVRECDVNGVQISVRRTPTEYCEILRFARKRNPFNHMSTVFKTEVVRKLGGYPNLYLREDYGLWIKLLSSGYRAANTSQVLVDATTDHEFFKRRGGFRHIKGEIDLQTFIVKHGVKSVSAAIVDGVTRCTLYVMPNFLRKFIYLKMLRNR